MSCLIQTETLPIFDAAADGHNMGKYARACRRARSIVRKCRRGGAVKRFNRSVGEAAGQIGQEAAPGVAEGIRAVPKSSNLEPKVAAAGALDTSVPLTVVWPPMPDALLSISIPATMWKTGSS
jgi:hypothetical protein